MVRIGLPCSPEWLCSLMAALFGLLGMAVILYIAYLVLRAWQESRED